MNYKTMMGSVLAMGMLLGPVAQADEEPLRIGVDIPYAPYQIKEADGTITGFEVELIEAVCQQMQRECVWVEQGWDGIIPGLLARKYDFIASSMNITDERARQVLFSEPYFQVPSVWVGRKGSQLDPENGSLEGVDIGVQMATIQDEYVTQFYPDADIHRYSSSSGVVNDMYTGRLELVFTAFPLAQDALLGKTEYSRVGKLVTGPESIYGPGVGAAFRKRDSELVEEFNAAMAEVKQSGTFDKLHQQYFGE